MNRLTRSSATMGLLLLLAACGGGGKTDGGGGGNPPPAVDISAVPANDPGSALPVGWQTSGAFMEIYVRAFKDSDGDGIGDLQGLIQNLDYLQDLGIKGIWLMPINQSYDRDHGYAVSDYRAVESDYGSMADLETLLSEAHERGIGVIMDYVINHSADTNPLFENARSSPSSPFRDWYIWSATAPEGWNIYGNNPWHASGGSWYFGGFWQHMPDLNLRNPDVVAYQDNNLRFWLNKGIDGFRFDAVGNLFENGPSAWETQPENLTHMSNVRTLLNGYSQRYMVCEAPAAPLQYGDDDVCASAFAFGLNYALVGAAKGDSGSIQTVANYFKTASTSMATMASNHDSFAGARIYNQVGGNINSYKMVASAYLTLPGIPFIYYGEEIGMAGGQGLSGDASLRSPLSWTSNAGNGGFTSGTPFRSLSSNVATHNIAAAIADPASIYHHYKALLALRNSHAALSKGNYQFSAVQGKVLSFQRSSGSDRILVVLNYDGAAAAVTISNLPANATLTPLFPAGLAATSANGSGQAALTPAGQSVSIYQF